MIRITLLYSILFFGVVSGLLAQSDPKAGAKKVLTLRAAGKGKITSKKCSGCKRFASGRVEHFTFQRDARKGRAIQDSKGW